MNTTSFNQSCPICGRKLLVLVEYLGMEVQCSHCKGFFRAQETTGSSWRKDELQITIDRRVDELLAMRQTSAAAR